MTHLARNRSVVMVPTVIGRRVHLTPHFHRNRSRVFRPTAGSVEPVPQEIFAAFLVNASTFFSPSVAVETQQLAVDALVVNSSTVHAPTLESVQAISPSLVVNTPTVHAPTVTAQPDQLLDQRTRLNNTSTVFAPTVALEADLNLAPPLVTNTSTVFVPDLVDDEWPNEANTGPTGTLTPHVGNYTTSANGEIIEDLDISGKVFVNHDNVILRNCIVTYDGMAVEQNSSNPNTGLLIEDCIITGGPGASSSEAAVGWANYTIRRTEFVGVGEGPAFNGEVLIEDCYLHDFTELGSEAHQDGLQTISGSNMTIRHNRILMNPENANAAIIIGTIEGTSIDNVLIENNLMAGGGYTLFGGVSTGYPNNATNVRVINNYFSAAYFDESGFFGPWTNVDAPLVRSGNRWYEDSANHSAGELLAGQGLQTLTPTLATNVSAVHDPTVTNLDPAVMHPGLTINESTVHAPTLAAQSPQNLAPPLVTNDPTMHSPTLASVVTVSAATLTSGNEGNGSTPNNDFSTASISPGSNKLLLLTVIATCPGGSTPPAIGNYSVSGNGLTWVAVTERVYGSRRRIMVWRAMGSSPSTGAITVTKTSGSDIQDWAWAVDEFSNVNTGGTNGSAAVGTFDVTGTESNTSLTLTLTDTIHTGDRPWVAFGVETTGSNPTVESGWSELARQPDLGNVRNLVTAIAAGGSDASHTTTWSGGSAAAGMVGTVINVAA